MPVDPPGGVWNLWSGRETLGLGWTYQTFPPSPSAGEVDHVIFVIMQSLCLEILWMPNERRIFSVALFWTFVCSSCSTHLTTLSCDIEKTEDYSIESMPEKFEHCQYANSLTDSWHQCCLSHSEPVIHLICYQVCVLYLAWENRSSRRAGKTTWKPQASLQIKLR